MKTLEILDEIKDICKRTGIKIIYESKGFPPGYCRVNNKQYLVVNRFLSKEEKLEEMLTALKEADLGDVYIKPFIREHLDKKDELF